MFLDNVDEKIILENITIDDVEYSNIYILKKGIICITKEFDDFKIISSVKNMALKLNIDYSLFTILQERNEKTFKIYFSGSKEIVEDLDDILPVDEESFIEQPLDYIESDIRTFNNQKEVKIKTYPDGTTFFRNNSGVWTQASDYDTLAAFRTLLYGGPFGIHKLMEKNYVDFILFLFTGGLFSLGYIEEMVPFWFDCKKDKDGRYFIPLDKETKRMFVIPQILMVIGNLILCAFYFFLLRTFL